MRKNLYIKTKKYLTQSPTQACLHNLLHIYMCLTSEPEIEFFSGQSPGSTVKVRIRTFCYGKQKKKEPNTEIAKWFHLIAFK